MTWQAQELCTLVSSPGAPALVEGSAEWVQVGAFTRWLWSQQRNCGVEEIAIIKGSWQTCPTFALVFIVLAGTESYPVFRRKA